MDHIPVRFHPLPQEDANGHEHAHDGDGETDIGYGVQMGVVLRHGVLVDVEDEGKVGEVGAGALGVGCIVAHLCMNVLDRSPPDLKVTSKLKWFGDPEQNVYVELTRNAYMKGDEIKSPHFGFK